MKNIKIAYVVSDLKRVGPTNQTLNIIKNSPYKNFSSVITLFPEEKGDSMLPEFKAANIPVKCLDLGKLSYFMAYKKLARIIASQQYDIVHSCGIRPDFLCQKACKIANSVHVVTLRNFPKEDIFTRMGLIRGVIAFRQHIYTLKKSNHIVACSYAIKQKMQQAYPNMSLSVIQNGVDQEKYHPISNLDKIKKRKKLGIPASKTVYISSNSFIKRKHIDETISGFLTSSANQNSILVLLGDGAELPSLSHKFKFPNIIFAGKVNNVNEYLQIADAFISSSESEGLPNSVLEAIATDVPVLLSNIPQHQEILDAMPDSGILYTIGDITDLSEKIPIVIAKSTEKKPGVTAKNLAMNVMSQKYAKYYKDILKEREKNA